MNGMYKMNKNSFLLVRDIVVMLLATISFSVAVTVNCTPLYKWFVTYYHLAHLVNLSSVELMSNYQNLLKYLNCFWIHSWKRTIPASHAGLVHFSDVKGLIQINWLILLISGIGAVYLIKKRMQQHQMWQLVIPLQFLGMTVLGLIFILIADFKNIFLKFHQIAFSNQDWLFNPKTDPIINALPPEFFEMCALNVLVVCIIIGMLIYLLSKKELKK